jgi:phospholipid transport system substrate-binding protein
MLTRRSLLSLTGVSAVLLLVPGLGRAFAAPTPDQATTFVRTTGDQLVAVVNGPGVPADKRPRMQSIVDTTVDVEGLARYALGSFWSKATVDQQKQYLALFHDVLLNNITGKLGDYKGVHFTIGRATPRSDVVVVNTTIERPNNPPTQVDWWISDANGKMQIVDVVAEGTSLRLTQRSDYASYLHRNGDNVQALIDAMRQQVSQNG